MPGTWRRYSWRRSAAWFRSPAANRRSSLPAWECQAGEVAQVANVSRRQDSRWTSDRRRRPRTGRSRSRARCPNPRGLATSRRSAPRRRSPDLLGRHLDQRGDDAQVQVRNHERGDDEQRPGRDRHRLLAPDAHNRPAYGSAMWHSPKSVRASPRFRLRGCDVSFHRRRGSDSVGGKLMRRPMSRAGHSRRGSA